MGQILDAMTLASLVNNVLKFAVAGPAVWLMALGTVILLFVGYGHIKAVRNKRILQESEEQKQQDQISNKTENQEISAGAEAAENTVSEARAQNPDADKKPRPSQ